LTGFFRARIVVVMLRGIIGVILAAAFSLPSSALAGAVPTSKDLKSVVPGSAKYERKMGDVDYYEMQAADGRSVGLAFVTSQVPPEVGGYAGEVDVLVGMDWEGRITGAAIIGHSENREYVDRIVQAGLLGRFVGRRAGEDFGDIEAVTGATITSQAIIDDVRTAAKAVYDHIMGRSKAGAAVTSFLERSSWPKGLGALAMVVLAVTSVSMPSRRWLRALSLAGAFVIVGLWLNSPITIGNVVDARNAGLPWLYNLPLAILMLFALVAALAKGNLYCSYVCPFGALQEGAARLSPRKIVPDKRLTRGMRWLRWIMAIVAIYAIAALGSDAMRTVEPFSLLFMRYPDSVTIVQAGVVVAASLFVRRVWCRYLCPTGLVLDIFAQLGCKVRHFIRRKAGRCNAGDETS